MCVRYGTVSQLADCCGGGTTLVSRDCGVAGIATASLLAFLALHFSITMIPL
jgi:hypothetical protein